MLLGIDEYCKFSILSLLLINPKAYESKLPENLKLSFAGNDGSDEVRRGGRGNKVGSLSQYGNFDNSTLSLSQGLRILGLFLNGWTSRVATDIFINFMLSLISIF